MKATILLLMLMCMNESKGQHLKLVSDKLPRTGFIYVKGLSWTENQKQDEVLEIIVEGDTMTVIRNLLLYCLQEKEENEHAYYVLSRLNLDHISTLIKNKEFDFYVKEYRKVVEKNNNKRGIYPKKKRK